MIRLEKRPEPSRAWSYAAPLVAVLASVGLAVILGRMLGDYDFGDGRKKKDESYMIFFYFFSVRVILSYCAKLLHFAFQF